MVIRDCTGTYVRFDGTDHPVCNSEVLKSIEDGTKIVFNYKYPKLNNCDDFGLPHCALAYGFPFGDWIKILKINSRN